MKILVTGGAGYIGSILVPQLLKGGHNVIVVDNFMYNQVSLLDCCCHSNLTIIRGDARDKQLIVAQLKHTDAIFPLACLTGAPPCEKDPIGAQTTNHDAIKMIIDLRSKDQIIIFPTTNSGYGVGQDGIYCT
ncbi:MAG: NAD-dependent epimerase/dehydratase, partial [bacterium]